MYYDNLLPITKAAIDSVKRLNTIGIRAGTIIVKYNSVSNYIIIDEDGYNKSFSCRNLLTMLKYNNLMSVEIATELFPLFFGKKQ